MDKVIKKLTFIDSGVEKQIIPEGVSEEGHTHSSYLTSTSDLNASKITGTISINNLPASALERLVVVANSTARFALTTANVQLGDTVKETDTGLMYYVKDVSKLNGTAGYEVYTAGIAAKIGTSTIGSPSNPIYIDNGVPKASGTTIGAGNKPIYLSGGTITASSTTIGASNKPVFLSTGVITACTSPLDMSISGTAANATVATKLGTSNIGAGDVPMYLAGGTAKASTANVGSGIKPIFMTAGTLTQFSTTLGSHSEPVFLNAGTLTKCTNIAAGNHTHDTTYLKLSGGTMSGSITRNGQIASSGITTGSISICNGTAANGGGGIWCYGAENSNAGKVRLQAYTNSTNGYKQLDVNGDGTATFNGSFQSEKLISKSTGPGVVIQDTNFNLLTTSTSLNASAAIAFCDKNGTDTVNRIGAIRSGLSAIDESFISLNAYKPDTSDRAMVCVYYPRNGSPYAVAPITLDTGNDTDIITRSYISSNIKRVLASTKTIYVSNTIASPGDGSTAAKAMSVDDLKTYLNSTYMSSATGNINGSYKLTICFVPTGTSYGTITFDSNKMSGIRSIYVTTSTGTATTLENYTTNRPVFDNFYAQGMQCIVELGNIEVTNEIRASYGGYITVKNGVGARNFTASYYGNITFDTGLILIHSGSTDTLFLAQVYSNIVVNTATTNFHFIDQCYYKGSIIQSTYHSRIVWNYSRIKLTGTKPVVTVTQSGTLTGTSSTAAGTAAKVVTLAEGQTFTLATNATAYVKFDNNNTANNPTLNINSTGAKPLYYNGTNIPANYLNNQIQYKVVYNGTQYEVENRFNRLLSISKLSLLTSSGSYSTTYNEGEWNWTGFTKYYDGSLINDTFFGYQKLWIEDYAFGDTPSSLISRTGIVYADTNNKTLAQSWLRINTNSYNQLGFDLLGIDGTTNKWTQLSLNANNAGTDNLINTTAPLELNPIFNNRYGIKINKDNSTAAKGGILLTGTAQNFAISVSDTSITKGTAPSATRYLGIDFYGTDIDNYNKRLGMLQYVLYSSNQSSMQLTAYNCTTNTNTGVTTISSNVDANGKKWIETNATIRGYATGASYGQSINGDNAAITLNPTAASGKAFGVYSISSKDGRLGLTVYNYAENKLRWQYTKPSDTGSGGTRAMTWDGDTGALTTTEFVGNLTGTASNATVATKLGTVNVGAGNKPMYLASGTPTAFSTSIGSAINPIYLNSGVVTASGTTIGATNKPIFMNSGTFTALSSTIGSHSEPVYINGGVLTKCTSVAASSHNHDSTYLKLVGGTMSGNIYWTATATIDGTSKTHTTQLTLNGTSLNFGAYDTTYSKWIWVMTPSGNATFYGNASTATKVGTDTVGSGTKPIYLNAGAPTAFSATVGTGTKPIYLNAGSLTAFSATVGTGTKPIYLNAGTLTAFSATVGSHSEPVFLNGGTITQCTNVASDSTVVHIAGTETITGAKTFSSDITGTGGLVLKATDIVKDETPSATKYKTFIIKDANNTNLSGVQYSHRNTGSYDVKMYVYKRGTSSFSSIIVGYDVNGVAYGQAPATSTARTDSTDIITRGYLNDTVSNYLLRGSYERIEGTTDAHKDLNSYTTAGFYNVKTANIDNKPDGIGTDAVLLVYPWLNSNGSNDERYIIQEITEAATSSNVRKWIRKRNNTAWLTWKQVALTDSNITGTASNITGVVSLDHGGTGATTRLNALKALTQENVGTSATHFLTITTNWAKGGYSSVADTKTVLGINGTAGTETLAWGTSVTLATVNSIAIKAKLPANPNTDTDTKVNQHVGTTNVERPILSRYNTADASQTANYVVYDTGVTNNPNKHTLTASGGFIGNLTGTASNATVATKVGTTTVGTGTKPIYLNAGVPTAFSATVGTGTKPMYLNAGALTAFSATVGSHSVPIFLSAGTLTKCTNVASNTTVVHLTGNETIAGTKTFSSDISGNVLGSIKKVPSGTTYVNALKEGQGIVSSQASAFGAIFNAPTKNYRIALATWPGSNDNVYLYSESNDNIAAGTNKVDKTLTWAADTGTLTANTFSGNLLSITNTANAATAPSIKLSGTAQNYAIELIDTSVTKGTAPSAAKYWGLNFFGNASDNANKRIGYVDVLLSTANTSSVRMVAYGCASATTTTNCIISANVDSSGNAYVKLGSSTIGSGTKPIYLNAGTLTAFSATVGTGTKPIYMNGGSLTAFSATVGSGTKPIYLSAGSLTAFSATVGSHTEPIFLSAGALTKCTSAFVTSATSPTVDGQIVLFSGTTGKVVRVAATGGMGNSSRPIFLNTTGKLAALSDTVGSSTIPVYMKGGTITAFTATVGSHTEPIFLSGGTLTKCTNVASKTVATTAANGLMTSAMVTKLNGIADNANNYTHPTTAGNKHVPSGGTTGKILGWDSAGTAKWISPGSADFGVDSATQGFSSITVNGTTCWRCFLRIGQIQICSGQGITNNYVSFPKAFTSNPYIVCTGYDSGDPYNIIDLQTSKFKCVNRNRNDYDGDSTSGFQYIAIGAWY